MTPISASNVRDALTAAMGLVTQSSANYQYTKDGTLLPAAK